MTSGRMIFWQLTPGWRQSGSEVQLPGLFMQKREDVDLGASSHSCNKMSLLEG